MKTEDYAMNPVSVRFVFRAGAQPLKTEPRNASRYATDYAVSDSFCPHRTGLEVRYLRCRDLRLICRAPETEDGVENDWKKDGASGFVGG